jgi:hypothetical protein
MGRKSKKGGEVEKAKPACFYCLRTFENEDVLYSHQKLIHFKCPDCGKKFSSAPGMGIHMRTIHGTELKSVPKAEPGRDDPALNITGTQNVPSEEEREEMNRKRARMAPSLDSLIDAVAASVAESEANANHVPAPTAKGLVYSDEHISPEEKRALLDRYKFDENAIKAKLNAKDASIEARLSALRNRIHGGAS